MHLLWAKPMHLLNHFVELATLDRVAEVNDLYER